MVMNASDKFLDFNDVKPISDRAHAEAPRGVMPP